MTFVFKREKGDRARLVSKLMGLPYLLILSQNTGKKNNTLIGRACLPLHRIVPSLIRNYCCHHFYDVVGKCRQKKSIQKFAPSAKKKTNKGSSSSRASRRRYSCTKHIQTHTHTGMNCCCDGMSVNKKPIKRARNTLLLLLLFQQESQPTSSSNNGKPTNQTGRAEPAANANKQQQQQRQRKQLRRRFCGDCTFFQHTTRNTPPCGAQSASTATAATATVPIRKVFQCSPATRRVASSQMLLEWRSLAPYMYV